MNEPVFARRALAILVGVCVTSFVAGILLAVFGQELIGIESHEADAYSYSAIGHRALVDTLDEVGVPVFVSTWDSARRAGNDGVLAILEPIASEQTFGFDGATDGRIEQRMREARTTLLVLPKWTGREHDRTGGWVGPVHQRNVWQIQNLMRVLSVDATVVREGDRDVTWRTGGFGPPPELRNMQLIQSPAIDPLIDCDEGILVGEIRWPRDPEVPREKRNRVVIVSDPDLLSNHGLARESNAIIAIRLIDHLRLGGAVVIDETVHGHEFKPTVFREAFRFPIALVPLQLVFCVLVLLWAGMGRFGSPRKPSPPLEPGNRFLIKNTAELLRVGGHSPEMLRRYLDDTVTEVRQKLHVRAGIEGDALVAALDRIGASRKVSTSYSGVAAEAADVIERGGRRPERVVHAARRIHDWRREILDGPGGGSQDS